MRINKIKINIVLLILSSLFTYLEWSNKNSFLYEIEFEILFKLFTNPKSIIHPFIIIPLLGQTILIVNLFLKKINKYLLYFAILCLGILIIFIFLIGVLNTNYKLIISTIPFITLSLILIKISKKNPKNKI